MVSLGCVVLLQVVGCKGCSIRNTRKHHDNIWNYVWQESKAGTIKELFTAVPECR